MNKTDITVILDRSGSMQTTKNDAIGGFNAFVEEQKKVPGEATLTLIQFDHEFKVDYASRPIGEVAELNGLTYQPRGNTALIDAMGRGISELAERVKKIKKADRPNCVVVIITDVEENASREWKIGDVNALIKKLTAKGYQFVFIGANQDAIKTGASFGVSALNSMSYASNSLGTQSVFSSVSKNVSAYRTGMKMDMSFDDTDKAAQLKAGVAS